MPVIPAESRTGTVAADPAPPTALGSRYLVRDIGLALPGDLKVDLEVAPAQLGVPFRWTWTRQDSRPVLDVLVLDAPSDDEDQSTVLRLTVDDVRALRDHLDDLLGERRATIPDGFAGTR